MSTVRVSDALNAIREHLRAADGAATTILRADTHEEQVATVRHTQQEEQPMDTRIVYFYDDDGNGDPQAEMEETLEGYGITATVATTTAPPFYSDGDFDILLFDWGGMSMGNSVLQDFCREIIKHAEDHPSRVYVMASSFTGRAMMDAMAEMGDRPANVYLSINRGIIAIASICGVDGVELDLEVDKWDGLDD
jgi:hypothetical protein